MRGEPQPPRAGPRPRPELEDRYDVHTRRLELIIQRVVRGGEDREPRRVREDCDVGRSREPHELRG